MKHSLLSVAALILAALISSLGTSQGASLLLAGFDGNQTQNTIAPAATNSNSGVRELVNPLQDAGAIGEVGARIWTDQTTGKELQWSATSDSGTNWGNTSFTQTATSGSNQWVITQTTVSWINFEISNLGTANLTLETFHIRSLRTNTTTTPDELTISLVQNGTFANPPVLSPSEGLTATGPATINLNNDTNWNGYEFSFSSILSDRTLSTGETATFRIATANGSGGRTYLDNIAISGAIPEPSAALLGGLGALLLLRRRR